MDWILFFVGVFCSLLVGIIACLLVGGFGLGKRALSHFHLHFRIRSFESSPPRSIAIRTLLFLFSHCSAELFVDCLSDFDGF